MGDQEAAWKEAFQMFDRDNSGQISRREVVDLLKALGKSDDDAKAIAYNIMKADTSGDGKISWDEFKAEMEKAS